MRSSAAPTAASTSKPTKTPTATAAQPRTIPTTPLTHHQQYSLSTGRLSAINPPPPDLLLPLHLVTHAPVRTSAPRTPAAHRHRQNHDHRRHRRRRYPQTQAANPRPSPSPDPSQSQSQQAGSDPIRSDPTLRAASEMRGHSTGCFCRWVGAKKGKEEAVRRKRWVGGVRRWCA